MTLTSKDKMELKKFNNYAGSKAFTKEVLKDTYNPLDDLLFYHSK